MRSLCFQRAIASLALVPLGAGATPEAIQSLADALPQASAEEVAAFAGAHVSEPLEDPYERAWWHLTFLRWFETDRAAAGAFALEHDEHGRHIYAVMVAAQQLDPGSAVGFAASLGERASRILEGATRRREAAVPAAEDLPDEADDEADDELNFAGALAGPLSRSEQVESIKESLKPLAETNPARAIDLVLAFEGDRRETDVLQEALRSVLSTSDPEALSGLVGRFPPGWNRTRFTTGLVYRWVRRDPKAGMDWAVALPAGPERDAAIGAAAAANGNSDPLAILEILEKNGWRMDMLESVSTSNALAPGDLDVGSLSWGRGTPKALGIALTHLASQGKGAEALAYSAQIHNARLRDDLIRNVVEAWFASDPIAAFEWANDARPEASKARAHISTGIARVGASGDYATATSLLGKITDPKERNWAVYRFTEIVGPGNTDEVARELSGWAAGLPEDQRDGARASIINGLTNFDPAAAAKLLAALPPTDELAHKWGRVTHQWLEQDPAATVAFFEAHAEAIPPKGYEGFVENWSQDSPAEASQWVADLARGERRDRAIQGLVRHLIGEGQPGDLDAATRWAAEIDDPARRRGNLTSIRSSTP
ncbi:hypothetical protein BH23VER1_BH23VER1_09020 [soil metagenome]